MRRAFPAGEPIAPADRQTMPCPVWVSDEAEIAEALETCESERPSGPDLETCLDSSRRQAFPAAEVAR